jgi:integrase
MDGSDPDWWRIRKWMRRYKSPRTGRPTETYLCSAIVFTAKEARLKIEQLGADPVQAKRDAKARFKTFGEVTASWIADKQLTDGRLYTANLYLRQHCADLRDQQMSAIDADRIISTLRPLIHKHWDTAKRVLDMLHTMFEYAIGWNWFTGNNPARWKGLHETRWPKRPKGRNHPGMPYTEVPHFMRELRIRQPNAIAAVALELTILTACRTQEILEMRWSEIDWGQKVWVMQAQRTKQRAGHRVPLTDRMIQILREREKLWQGSEYVFWGNSDAALAEKSMFHFLRNSMGIKDYTVHGFRNSFSDWAYETTEFEPHLIELSLGHAWGNATTRSYFRGDALEKRRALMVAWTNYCG